MNIQQNTIILLDLNYTLVANSAENRYIRPYQKKIIHELYREWLVELIKDYYVIIITARPNYQEKETMDSIKEKLNGWMPHEAYFQEENDAPPIAKEKLLKKYIFPKHGTKNSIWQLKATLKLKKCIKSMKFSLYQFMMRKD